jgi:predicted signal transduction protein with EAL and GGDEF domain
VLDRLIELGCDTGQGYLISRPLPGDDLTAWLRETGRIRLEPPATHDAARTGATASSSG